MDHPASVANKRLTHRLNPLDATFTTNAGVGGPPTQFPDHAFIRSVTCPEGVHRTYYWSLQFAPPSFSQATVPSFTSPVIFVGGGDGLIVYWLRARYADLDFALFIRNIFVGVGAC